MGRVRRWIARRRRARAGVATAAWGPVDLPGRGLTWAIDRPGPSPQAPAVVLLHGLVATGPLNWDPVIEPLAERFRVIALDHRGHGRGIRPDEPFSLEDCADDVAALLDVLGVGRAVLVGYSMGGAIGQLTWWRHPTRVAGLVLLATAARFAIPPGSELLTRLVAEADRFDDDRRGGLFTHSPRDIHHAVRSLADFDSRSWLGTRDVPAAVLETTRDRVVSPRLQRELAALVADGRTVELELGHLGVVLDRGAITPAVLAACDDLVAESGLGLRWWRRRPRRWPRRLAGRRVGAAPGQPSDRSSGPVRP